MRGGSGSGSAGVGRYPDAVIIVFGLVGLALVVVIGLVLVGRETARLAGSARPAVFDMEQAVDFIAERISPEAQGRLSHEYGSDRDRPEKIKTAQRRTRPKASCRASVPKSERGPSGSSEIVNTASCG